MGLDVIKTVSKLIQFHNNTSNKTSEKLKAKTGKLCVKWKITQDLKLFSKFSNLVLRYLSVK